MKREDLDHRYGSHPAVDPAIAERHEAARILVKELAIKMNELLPEGREKSLVFTHLDDVAHWAHDSIARGKL